MYMQVLLGLVHATDANGQPGRTAGCHNVFQWWSQHTLGGFQQCLRRTFPSWSHHQLQDRQVLHRSLIMKLTELHNEHSKSADLCHQCNDIMVIINGTISPKVGLWPISTKFEREIWGFRRRARWKSIRAIATTIDNWKWQYCRQNRKYLIRRTRNMIELSCKVKCARL